MSPYITAFQTFVFLIGLQLHSQRVPWTRATIPANVSPALCILPVHRAASLPSRCSHFSFTWVQRWHPSLGRRLDPEGRRVKSPSSLPSFLPSSSLIPAPPVGGGSAPVTLECHQRWDSKGDTWQPSDHRCCHSNVTQEQRKPVKFINTSWQGEIIMKRSAVYCVKRVNTVIACNAFLRWC